MAERHERERFWIEHGMYAVQVEVEVVYPTAWPTEACLTPAASRFLDEVARRAEAGDLKYLQSVGRVFQAVPTTA